MSMRALFAGVVSRLGRTKWGTKIKDFSGEERDTAVDQLAQEIAALLNSDGPIVLREPIQFIKKHGGPLFRVVYGGNDDSPLAQFYRDGQQISQVQPTAAAESSTTTERVTQNIANAVGSLYRVVSVQNGQVTLDELDINLSPTGTQIQARAPT